MPEDSVRQVFADCQSFHALSHSPPSNRWGREHAVRAARSLVGMRAFIGARGSDTPDSPSGLESTEFLGRTW